MVADVFFINQIKQIVIKSIKIIKKHYT
jgi:hypothetical protein